MVDRFLAVVMNGVRAGTLSKMPSGSMTFDYDSKWRMEKRRRSVSMSLRMNSLRLTSEAVGVFFGNLLTDNQVVLQQIVDLLHLNGGHPFDVLEATGRD